MTTNRTLVREFCAVVEGNGCEAPPCEGGPTSRIPTCYSCGEPACRACSEIIPYYTYGRQRVCFHCIIDRTRGTTLEKAGEAFVDWCLNVKDIYPAWLRGVRNLRDYLSQPGLTQKARHQAKRDLEHRLDAKPKRVPKPKFAIVHRSSL